MNPELYDLLYRQRNWEGIRAQQRKAAIQSVLWFLATFAVCLFAVYEIIKW